MSITTRTLLCSTLLFAAGAAHAFDIAKDGKPVAVIATGANPTNTTLFAANELASYLGKMVGSPFTVVTNDPPAEGNCILVGAPVEGAKCDEIRLRVRDGRILDLTGQPPRGPLYAVYEFLERQGCGFWSDFNESVPAKADISVDDTLDYAYAPPFSLRSNSGTTAVYHAKWNPKARLNGHGGIPAAMGGRVHVDMSESSLGLNHGELARENFAKHPEWYSWARPQGSTKMQRTPEQLCFTNPELQEKLVERAREILKEKPHLTTLSCSYADVAPACSCPNCSAVAKREGTKAAILLTGVNAIARAVAEDYPDLTITFLAYGMNSIIPPKQMKIEPNVACVYANLARNYAKPPVNTNAIARWSELTGGKVYIWGYGAMFHNYIMPTPTVDLLGPEMRFYRDLGVLGVSSQLSQTGTSDCIDLVCWLYGKMAWNPDYDEWELIDRWCDGALGAGSPFLKKWLRMERDYRPNIRYLGPYEVDNRVCLSPELLLQGYDLFREALEATKDDPRPHGQLVRMYGSILSALVERYNFDIAETARKEGRADFPDRDGLFAQFAAIAHKYGNWIGENSGSATSRIQHSEILRHIDPATGKKVIPPWTFRNPVSKLPAQDPFVTWDDKSGFYYFLSSTGDQIDIRRGKHAAKLVDSDDKCVAWRPAAKGSAIAGHLTSPELHRGDDGHWYIYASGSDGMTLASSFSAGGGDEEVDFGDMGLGDDTPAGTSSLKGDKDFKDVTEMLEYRMFVLQSKTDDPFGGFEFKGILDKKVSALDPTVFRGPDGVLYLAYAQQAQGTSIMVRKMKDWMTVDEDQKPIPIVTAHNQTEIFEAPSFITRGDKLFLVYSSGGRWSNACQLEVREYTGPDICRNSSWGGAKKGQPILTSGSKFDNRAVSTDKFARGIGPGHASFFPSPDGRQLWCAYHAMQRPNVGTGPAEVFMYQQRVEFNAAGMPNMGKPEVDSAGSPATFVIIPSGEPGSPPVR